MTTPEQKLDAIRALCGEWDERTETHYELIRQVRVVLDAPSSPVPHEHEFEFFDRSICGSCGAMHYYCRCGQFEPCDESSSSVPPAPDPAGTEARP